MLLSDQNQQQQTNRRDYQGKQKDELTKKWIQFDEIAYDLRLFAQIIFICNSANVRKFPKSARRRFNALKSANTSHSP